VLGAVATLVLPEATASVTLNVRQAAAPWYQQPEVGLVPSASTVTEIVALVARGFNVTTPDAARKSRPLSAVPPISRYRSVALAVAGSLKDSGIATIRVPLSGAATSTEPAVAIGTGVEDVARGAAEAVPATTTLVSAEAAATAVTSRPVCLARRDATIRAVMRTGATRSAAQPTSQRAGDWTPAKYR